MRCYVLTQTRTQTRTQTLEIERLKGVSVEQSRQMQECHITLASLSQEVAAFTNPDKPKAMPCCEHDMSLRMLSMSCSCLFTLYAVTHGFLCVLFVLNIW